MTSDLALLRSLGIQLAFGLAMLLAACAPGLSTNTDIRRWEQRAGNVTITRDDWGIPHVYGKSDADAVFGLIYAQAEDDFNRIEMNYLNALGRTAEAEGESYVYQDLRMRLLVDHEQMKALYASSPAWLKDLMTASADGLNFFLATHPNMKPKVLNRFEPWMVLPFAEGSIGWDIENVSLFDLEAFYGRKGPRGAAHESSDTPQKSGGSNAIAIGPERSASGHALLLINPHTTFFFRAEAQVQSDEGLNAYGAVTWGQFFVYHGFNERLGWTHTSTNADRFDEYAETIVDRPNGLFYRYGAEERPVVSTPVTIRYRAGERSAERSFTIYRTHHGPVVREVDGKWIAVRLMQEPVKLLMQSFLRTKATGYQMFRDLLALHTNSSNNTVYADTDGNIAYFHANFVPRRDSRFDWTRPVDGTDPATEWQGLHSVDESPNVNNPANGWIQNTNNWPYSAAGPDSPKITDFPLYMDSVGENARGVHAIRVLSNERSFTLESLIAAAYDTYLPAFDQLLPALFDAYSSWPESNPLKAKLAQPIAVLETWDRRWAVDSVPTAVAVYWAKQLWRMVGAPNRGALKIIDSVVMTSTPAQRLEALSAAIDRLTSDFGTWRTAWGEINRLQRLTADLTQPFSDSAPSVPIGFTSSQWGSLADFDAATYPTTKRMYGTEGNSFVAVVEFGERLKAKAITVGGQSGDPRSPHFSDQMERYSKGSLRDVYFYREDLAKHATLEYQPGR